ncbi:MAG: ribonuclease HI [Cytophagales bacterium]|nr:ribonuclease HI [Cytophagales bacterium]
MVTIYTDGASRGNPGPGGYATILKYKNHRKELSQGFRKTTNNRMELLAVVVGLEALKKERQAVTVYSDSQYVVNAVRKGWLRAWIKKDFKGKKNVDLWQRFWKVYQKHQVTLRWIKGHAGHVENERCDQLAVQRTKGKALLIDHGYEQ